MSVLTGTMKNGDPFRRFFAHNYAKKVVVQKTGNKGNNKRKISLYQCDKNNNNSQNLLFFTDFIDMNFILLAI